MKPSVPEPTPVNTAHVDTGALTEETARREAAARAALKSLSHLYHSGTQPLTVARARVDVMRKLYPEDDGAWIRKS